MAAFANAGNALSGRLLGEGNYSSLKRLAWDLNKMAVMIAALLSLVYAIGYVWTGPLFSPYEAVVEEFNAVYWVVIICQPINAIAFTFDGMFKGMGETAYLRNVLLFGTLFGFVPILLLGHFLSGELIAVWIAFFVWMIIRGGALWWKFQRKYVPLADRSGP